MKKILVTYQIPRSGLAELFEKFEVSYPDKPALSRAEVLAAIPAYDALIPPGVQVDRALLDAAANLKLISNYGAGYDNIDVDYCTAKGILVTNIPEAVTESTAEVAFGLMLAVMRRIPELDRKLRLPARLDWGVMSQLGHNLYGKTLGIIGMGRIGMALAKRASAFGMKIVYSNRKPLAPAKEAEVAASYAELRELLQKSDVISIHVPYSPQTRHFIGPAELALLKPTAYLINTSRGPVIDEAALVQSLKAGRIAGAGLDVFENEPAIPPELMALDQVVLTPHIGTRTIEAREGMARAAAQNVLDFFAGKQPAFMVNPEVMSRK